MKTYRFQVCAEDGSTPLSERIVEEVDALDYVQARVELHKRRPGYEVVSWGLAKEIDEAEARWERERWLYE